jgi:flagellar biosynthesis/type III secretory pathway M-ring protein FliF/YscJ
VLAEVHPQLPALLEQGASWVTRRKKGALICALGGAVLIAAAICCVKLQADVPLFDADLHPAQAIEVRDALTLWGEPFRENAQDTQIFVPAATRRDVLLRLTLAGLPHRFAPTSADVLSDQTNALTPLSVIDDRRRAGIEGDIVDGLRHVAGVADAAVVLPPIADDSLIGDESRTAPSAGVQLIMQPGAQLTSEQIVGIKRFVAAAYPGLIPDRVTVVDGSGAVLATSAPDRAASRERRVQEDVQSALDAVLGKGAAVVRVSVQTSAGEAQVQSTRVVPHGLLSAETGAERGSETGKTYDKERSVRRYAYDTISEKRTTAVDAPVHMSVAVFLDSGRVDPGSTATIASLVRAAAGADIVAGDDVVVSALPFASPAPAARTADARQDAASRAIAPAALACALALFGFASIPKTDRCVVKTEAAPTAPSAVLSEAAARIAREISGESPQAAAYVLSSTCAATRDEVLTVMGASRRSEIARYLSTYDGV